jgi:hypothetical protein
MGSYVEGNGAFLSRSRMSAILALLVALIGAACAALGIIDRDLYGALVRAGALGERTAIASVAQDLVLLTVSVLLLATTALFLDSTPRSMSCTWPRSGSTSSCCSGSSGSAC